MKAARIDKPGVLHIVNIPRPNPKHGEALCKVRRAGICGTDYSIYKGTFSAVKDGRIKFPLQPGHEWSGEVIETGEGVTSLKKGMRVLGDNAISCGQCSKCREGKPMQCENLRSVGTVNAWDGAMAEYVIYPVRHLFTIPDSVGFDQAALVEPTAIAMHAVYHAPVRGGDRVAVLGTGPIGMAALELCRVFGASQIISVGRNNQKLELSKVFGATDIINTCEKEPTATIKALTDNMGVDVAIELSGAKELFACGMKCVRRGGVLSIAAFYDDALEIEPGDIVFNELTIKPVSGCFGMIDKVIHLMNTGQISLDKMITHRCTLDGLKDCLDNFKQYNGNKLKTMLQFDDTS